MRAPASGVTSTACSIVFFVAHQRLKDSKTERAANAAYEPRWELLTATRSSLVGPQRRAANNGALKLEN
jgi:hypothetical protein